MFPAYMYLSAYDRHKKLMNDYFTLHGGSLSTLKRDTSRDKTDHDVIRENHKFLWDEDNEADTWGARLAKKYYDKLFKEYCIADLTYYKYNKVALRWRTEKEVVVGKGQFQCGNKKCTIKEGLRSWEVNFGYMEQGEKRNALVKLRLCPDCSVMLNYRSQKREAKRKKMLKRLGTSSETNNDNAPSTSTEPVDVVKIEEVEVADDDHDHAKESTVRAETDGSKVWKEKPVDALEKTREQEFEEYLADLFM